MESGVAVYKGEWHKPGGRGTTKPSVFAAVPLTSWARAFHVLEYWMQCPHQEEKNWTSQAEDELMTLGFRLLLLRITSGSSSVYSRAAVPRDPGTSQSTTAALNQNRIISSDWGKTHRKSRLSESCRIYKFWSSAENKQRDPGRHESSCPRATCVTSRRKGTDVSLWRVSGKQRKRLERKYSLWTQHSKTEYIYLRNKNYIDDKNRKKTIFEQDNHFTPLNTSMLYPRR